MIQTNGTVDFEDALRMESFLEAAGAIMLTVGAQDLFQSLLGNGLVLDAA